DALTTRLDGLASLRSRIDQPGAASLDQVEAGFTTVIDAALRIDDQLDADSDGRAVTGLTRTRELLAQEDSLVSGMLAAGSTGPAGSGPVVRPAGARAASSAAQVSRLSAPDRAPFDRVAADPASATLASLETALGSSGPNTPLPFTSAQWRSA